MHAVRKYILGILKECGGVTVAELAERLDMAPVSVRHHLDILQGDNLIRVERLERSGAVGRPQQVYALTDEAYRHFPNNYACLAASLVRQIKGTLPPDQVQKTFEAMAHDIASEFVPASGARASVELRLDQVAEFLNARGYLARWETAGPTPADGYLLRKYNCPYADVSSQHGELCIMDQMLINDLVGRPCPRVQSMADDERCCTYHILPAENELAA